MPFRPEKALACALAAATLASTLPAEAGERWRGHYPRPAPAERHLDAASLIAAGLIGLAAGAILAGIAGQQTTPLETAPREPAPREPAWRHPHAYPRPSPDRVYFPPAPPRGATAG